MQPRPQFDIKEIQEDIRRIKELIAMMERVGGSLPDLKAAVGRLEFAVNTGADLSAAAQETSSLLKGYVADLYRACGADADMLCRAAVDRQWQARSVRWTLSWEKPDSAVSLFVRNTLKRYLPKQICERLDRCR